jgi:hypothetical protein
MTAKNSRDVTEIYKVIYRCDVLLTDRERFIEAHSPDDALLRLRKIIGYRPSVHQISHAAPKQSGNVADSAK